MEENALPVYPGKGSFMIDSHHSIPDDRVSAVCRSATVGLV